MHLAYQIIMTNFIPIFPLALVVFPGEQLNLHIFEPRYKQLIRECFAEAKPFGIPSVINNAVAELGTLVEITEIVTLYEDGKLDVRTRGIQIFRILEVISTIPDKMYSGAIVNYPSIIEKRRPLLMKEVVQRIRDLHQILKVKKDFVKNDEDLTGYDIAHHAGLSIEEEYEFMGLFHEFQRLEYLNRHLKKILPMVSGIENLKEKIQLNGHFKELKGFTL